MIDQTEPGLSRISSIPNRVVGKRGHRRRVAVNGKRAAYISSRGRASCRYRSRAVHDTRRSQPARRHRCGRMRSSSTTMLPSPSCFNAATCDSTSPNTEVPEATPLGEGVAGDVLPSAVELCDCSRPAVRPERRHVLVGLASPNRYAVVLFMPSPAIWASFRRSTARTAVRDPPEVSYWGPPATASRRRGAETRWPPRCARQLLFDLGSDGWTGRVRRTSSILRDRFAPTSSRIVRTRGQTRRNSQTESGWPWTCRPPRRRTPHPRIQLYQQLRDAIAVAPLAPVTA